MKRLACILLLSPCLVWAQSSTSPDSSSAPPAGPPPGVASAAATAQYDSSLDQLRDKLTLRDEQQPYWRAFQNRIDAYVGLHLREKPAQAFASETAPRQIARLVDQLQNRLAALEDIELTAKELYEHLDPAQQKTANQLLMAAIPSFVSGARNSEPPSQGRGSRGDGPPRGGAGMGGGMGGGFGGGGF